MGSEVKACKNVFYTYVHIRIDTNKVFYVGKGKGNRAYVTKRRNAHWNNIVAKTPYTIHIVKDNLSEHDAFKLEIELIKQYGISNLCNLCLGGEGASGNKHTDSWKKEKSIANSGRNNPMFGISLLHSVETRLKISEGNKGRKVSEITRNKISKAVSGSNNGMHNYIFTDEQLANRKELVRHRMRKVNKLDLNYNLLETYDSVKEATRCTGIKSCRITDCCAGRKKSANGFIWQYHDVKLRKEYSR